MSKPPPARSFTLARLIAKAAQALEKATTAAEILEASKQAQAAYDAAKFLAKIKDAHDTVVAACHKVQADALEIETQAQRRLADEYDAAQERGEVQKAGGDRKSINVPNKNNDQPTVTDIGLTRKQVHEARIVRDAEKKKPGIVRKTLDKQADMGPPERTALLTPSRHARA